MGFVFPCRAHLRGGTAIVAPFFCLALVPTTAMAAGNDINITGTTLGSYSDLNGSVIIEPGANVVVNNQVTLGFAASPDGVPAIGLWVNGSIAVSGPNASLALTNSMAKGAQLEIGTSQGSSGNLLISNGAQVDITGGVIQAGWDEGSSGTITVTGQGSSLTAASVYVGTGDDTYESNLASGVLNIDNGGVVNADVVALGVYDSTGTINISDATLNVQQALITNYNGSGLINIDNGGVVAVLGQISLGYGSCNASDPGACHNPQTTVNLNPGGLLEVGGANGIVNDEPAQGGYAFNLAGGELQIINADLTTSVNMTLASATNSTIDTNGYDGTFSGTFSGAGGLIKAGAGTLVLTGAQTYNGGTTIEAGTVRYGTNSTAVDYDQNVTGPLTVSITPNAIPGTGSAQLQVDGTANLSKALIINLTAPASGTNYTLGTEYAVLTATGGISGHFSNISFTGAYAPYLTASPVYSDNEGEFRLLASDSAINTGRFYATAGYARNAALFDALSAPVGTDADYWLHGLGSCGHASGVNYNYKGFVIGRGFAVEPDLILGGALSNVYTHTAEGGGSYADGTTVGGEIYGIYTVPRWTITTTGAAGYLDNRSRRFLPGLGVGAVSSDGDYAGLSLHVGYDWRNQGPILLTPYAVVSYLHTHLGGGQENGLGALDTNYGQLDTDLAQAGGGLTGAYRVMDGRSEVTTWASLGGLGTLGNPNARVDEMIGMQAASITGQVASAGMLTTGAGVQLAGRTAPWKLALAWHGQFANRASGQAFTLNGSYRF